MGNYRIEIEGLGAHHNEPENPGDADKIARDAVAALKAQGHTLTRAVIEVPSSDGTRVEHLGTHRMGRGLFAGSPDYPRRDAKNQLLRYFDFEHLPEVLQIVSRPFAELARRLVGNRNIPDSAEKTVALRKLLEAKDAAVRAALPAE